MNAPPPPPESILAPLRKREIQPGLERIRRLLDHFGKPQDALPAVLVAGTNGKGSTASALASMARAAGRRSGLFTSPCLASVAEQFQVDGAPLSADELAALATEIVAVDEAAGVGITYFEALTALACLAFARRGVELAVLEAGMGGGRDSTNVAAPLVSLVTTVGLDHAAYLGDTLEEIAREKAGIFRRHRPALVGWIGEPARGVLARRARETGARLILAEDAVDGPRILARGERWRLALRTPKAPYELTTAMLGEHQARNLALAVLAAEELGLGEAAIVRGAAQWRFAGRLEWRRVPRPHGGVRRVLLDAAHNPESIAVLARYLAAHESSFDLLFGVLADKDANAMLELLAPHVEHGVLTCPSDGQRALSPAEFVAAHPRWSRFSVEPDHKAALALALAWESPRPLLICGSVRLAGDLRPRLGDPPPGGPPGA